MRKQTVNWSKSHMMLLFGQKKWYLEFKISEKKQMLILNNLYLLKGICMLALDPMQCFSLFWNGGY